MNSNRDHRHVAAGSHRTRNSGSVDSAMYWIITNTSLFVYDPLARLQVQRLFRSIAVIHAVLLG